MAASQPPSGDALREAMAAAIKREAPGLAGALGAGYPDWLAGVVAPHLATPAPLDVRQRIAALPYKMDGGTEVVARSQVFAAINEATPAPLDVERPATLNVPKLNDALHRAGFALPRSRRQKLADFCLRDVEAVARAYAEQEENR